MLSRRSQVVLAAVRVKEVSNGAMRSQIELDSLTSVHAFQGMPSQSKISRGRIFQSACLPFDAWLIRVPVVPRERIVRSPFPSQNRPLVFPRSLLSDISILFTKKEFLSGRVENL